MEITRKFAYAIVSLLLIFETVVAQDESMQPELTLREKKKIMRQDIRESLTLILSIIGLLMTISLCCFFFNIEKVKSDYKKMKKIEREEEEAAAREEAEAEANAEKEGDDGE